MSKKSKLIAKEFTSTVGRLVGGSVHEAIVEDFDGNPLTVKTGRNKGDETQRYSFCVAYPKAGKHWAESNELGALIWATGYEHMGDLAKRDDFSWKVKDGDDQRVNKRGRKNCENEGWPGNWVFVFSSSFAPDTCDSTGDNKIDPDMIKKGFYVQVRGSVVGNENDSNPGVYLNHNTVALTAYGPEIVSKNKLDPKKAGFGQNVVLPAGASTTPPPGMGSGATPPPPKAPNAAPPPPAAPAASLPPPPVVASVAVAPSSSFIAPPAAPVAPTPPAPTPPAAPVRTMTAKANGATYESFVAQGWTEAAMRAEGYLA